MHNLKVNIITVFHGKDSSLIKIYSFHVFGANARRPVPELLILALDRPLSFLNAKKSEKQLFDNFNKLNLFIYPACIKFLIPR